MAIRKEGSAYSFTKVSIVFKDVVCCLKISMGQGELCQYNFDVISICTTCIYNGEYWRLIN